MENTTNIKFNKVIDIEKFLPSSVDHPNILEALYASSDQDIKTSLNEEDFKKLDVRPDYKASRFTDEELEEIRKTNYKLIDEAEHSRR